ncbi:MAG: hypothetical protein ACREYF_01320 [Gammaproteobacteria bacterium]
MRLSGNYGWQRPHQKSAALSSRFEIYPRGMGALQAIRQSLGALVGPKFLTADQVTDRVRGRYPEAESLPPCPALDALLTQAGCTLVWNDQGDEGPAYYPAIKGFGPSAGTTTYVARHGSQAGPLAVVTEEIAEVRQFEDRLEYAVKAGGFLALTVPPRMAKHAEAELLGRFELERRSFDALLLAAMREQAEALNVDWQVVLRADGSNPGSISGDRAMELLAFWVAGCGRPTP